MDKIFGRDSPSLANKMEISNFLSQDLGTVAEVTDTYISQNKKLKLKKTQAKKNRETTSNKKLSVALIAVKKQEEDAKEQDAKFYNDLLKRTGLDMAVTLENLN